MNMNVEKRILKKALHDLVESYKTGLAFITNMKERCNNSLDVEFITQNFETIRSNEKYTKRKQKANVLLMNFIFPG